MSNDQLWLGHKNWLIFMSSPSNLPFPHSDAFHFGGSFPREMAAMIEKNDQERWGDPELDKAQAENDAIFAEIDGLKGLVQNGDMTIGQAQARFIYDGQRPLRPAPRGRKLPIRRLFQTP